MAEVSSIAKRLELDLVGLEAETTITEIGCFLVW
jgi:hypothetical protein